MATFKEFKDAGYTIEECSDKAVVFSFNPASVSDDSTVDSFLEAGGGELVDEFFYDNEPIYTIKDSSGNVEETDLRSISEVDDYIREMEIEE